MATSERDLFGETFALMEPDECLFLPGKSFPATGTLEIVSLDLSRIVPMPYVMAYGQGTLRESVAQPRPNSIDLDKSLIQVSLQRDAYRPPVSQSMVLEGKGRIGDYAVSLINMAFYEFYVAKPASS